MLAITPHIGSLERMPCCRIDASSLAGDPSGVASVLGTADPGCCLIDRDRHGWRCLPHDNRTAGSLPLFALWPSAIAVPAGLPVAEAAERLAERAYLLVTDEQTGEPLGVVGREGVFSALLAAFKLQEAYFRTVLRTTDASITAINDTGRTVIWTAGAERIFSVPAQHIIGQPIQSFFPRDSIQSLQTLATGEAVHRRQHEPRPGMTVLINAEPVVRDGQIAGVVVSEVDITNEVRLNRELFDATSMVHHLQRTLTESGTKPDPFAPIRGTSPAIAALIRTIRKVGSTSATALIVGESGVGKELAAKAIHQVRGPDDAPFVAINCGAIPSSLFESELFGYERGAFTGADQKGRKGKIEMARGGTLFLDEIAEMPPDLQVKLLRVLEEKKYYPIGATRLSDVGCAIIAATNRNLEQLVASGKFREDLYYRLNVVTVLIPPLRERKEDLRELIHTFLDEFCTRYGRVIRTLPYEVMQRLLDHDWPGNIRELRNTVERLVVLSSDGQVSLSDLPRHPGIVRTPSGAEAAGLAPGSDPGLASGSNPGLASGSSLSVPPPPAQVRTVREHVDAQERDMIVNALRLENGNKKAAAKRLGISRATLYNKLSRWERQ